MRIFIGGIGGAGMAPLALVAHQGGMSVSGSDKQDSEYIAYLKKHGITDISVGPPEDTAKALEAARPDWYIYSSALPKENPGHEELATAQKLGIKTGKRDDFFNHILEHKQLPLLAIAGTHGKTTTTAMLIWLLKQLGVPIGYAVGAKLSFGDMGELPDNARYFVYECDEFDRNFLSFHPYLSLITGIAWDHPDIYPTKESYNEAFSQFVTQSEHVIIWPNDAAQLDLHAGGKTTLLGEDSLESIHLTGEVNRRDAWQAVQAAHLLTHKPLSALSAEINHFPGLSRRFEKIAPNLYTDYAHTPEKIAGAIQTAEESLKARLSGSDEVQGDNEQRANRTSGTLSEQVGAPSKPGVVVVYEGLHNTRQHFIKEQLAHLFDIVKKLYVVPSYLAREDPDLKQLNPADIINMLSNPGDGEPAELNDNLKHSIQKHLSDGDLVLCLSAGGGGSLDEWLRKEF